MDIAGDIGDHMVMRDQGEIVAGGKISELKEKHFYLMVIGVKEGWSGHGYGGLLLDKMTGKPWDCCRNPLSDDDGGSYVVTTVARGSAVHFYERHGFAPCDFTEIPQPFREQCTGCPEKEGCAPVAMMMNGGK